MTYVYCIFEAVSKKRSKIQAFIFVYVTYSRAFESLKNASLKLYLSTKVLFRAVYVDFF
jgi:hypothetical protein